MALVFPSSPTVGQVFQSEGMTFVWSGVVWHVLDPFPWNTTGAGSGVMTPAATKAALDAVPNGIAFNFGLPQDMSASRALSTNYQNTFARPLLVTLTFNDRDDASEAELRTGPTNIAGLPIQLAHNWSARGAGGEAGLMGVIPQGWFYRGDAISRRPAVQQWWEWRN